MAPSVHYSRLILSERRRAAETIGIGAARLIAAHKLRIGQLFMVEALEKLESPPVRLCTAPGKAAKSPDLVGSDPGGGWHVVEAKGSSANPCAGLNMLDNKPKPYGWRLRPVQGQFLPLLRAAV